jgi:PTH1 family peptidyl-tRNA hydrolase
MTTPRIICCLGNPGRRYDDTRHNLGFRVADALAARARGTWSRPRDEFDWSRVRVAGSDVILVKPRTYMNLSGDALELLDEIEPVEAGAVLVVCDDLALPLGTLRLRTRGSDGGHNGLKSVALRLGTSAFPRLRLGVGPLPEDVDAADFVLARMTHEDLDAADRVVREAVRCVETLIGDGMATAMNRFNTRAAAAEE